VGTPEVGPLPEAVSIGAGLTPRFTPNQIRALKAQTGKSMEEILGEGADDADRLQAIVWLRLHKLGHRASWDQAGDVAVEIEDDPEPDPTNGAPSNSRPPSAASGA